MPNWDLINRTLDAIERSNPQNFNMENWAVQRGPDICDTRMCFAGWVVTTAGYDLSWSGARDYSEKPATTDVIGPSGRRVLISKLARELLDLTIEEAEIIFYNTGIQTPKSLRQHLYRILGTPATKER